MRTVLKVEKWKNLIKSRPLCSGKKREAERVIETLVFLSELDSATPHSSSLSFHCTTFEFTEREKSFKDSWKYKLHKIYVCTRACVMKWTHNWKLIWTFPIILGNYLLFFLFCINLCLLDWRITYTFFNFTVQLISRSFFSDEEPPLRCEF